MAKFLVVDNEATTVSALKALLKGDGHDVHAVTSGQEAIDALRRDAFDAVLSDLQMPHVAGHVVVRVAREHHPGACIFVSTAHPAPPALDEACHVFDKPLDYEGLVRTVAECRANGGPGHHGRCYLKPTREP